MLAILVWPFVGASVNRVHDIGQTGWMSLLLLVPIVNLVFESGAVRVPVLYPCEEFGGGVHPNLI